MGNVHKCEPIKHNATGAQRNVVKILKAEPRQFRKKKGYRTLQKTLTNGQSFGVNCCLPLVSILNSDISMSIITPSTLSFLF